MRLVDALPRGLKVLCLYEYKMEECPVYDENVSELKKRIAEGKLPLLGEIKGVDEEIVIGSRFESLQLREMDLEGWDGGPKVSMHSPCGMELP